MVETLSVQRLAYLKIYCVKYHLGLLSFCYYCIHVATKVISLNNKIVFFYEQSTKNNKYPNVSTNPGSVLVETTAAVVETSKIC